MRLWLLMLAIGVGTAAFDSGAQAQNYPWCAQYSGDMGGAQNCGFVSFEQCMQDVSGIGGFCMANNTYVPPPGPHRAPSATRHRARRPST